MATQRNEEENEQMIQISYALYVRSIASFVGCGHKNSGAQWMAPIERYYLYWAEKVTGQMDDETVNEERRSIQWCIRRVQIWVFLVRGEDEQM